MKTTLIAASSVTALLIALSAPAAQAAQYFGQPHEVWQRHAAMQDAGIDARQANQRQRVARGARSGDLTGGELQALGAGQRTIRAQEHEFQSDGVLTLDERRALREDLRIANRYIQQGRHDDERH